MSGWRHLLWLGSALWIILFTLFMAKESSHAQPFDGLHYVPSWEEASRLFDEPLLKPTYIPPGLKLRSHHVDRSRMFHHILFTDENNGIELVQYRGELSFVDALRVEIGNSRPPFRCGHGSPLLPIGERRSSCRHPRVAIRSVAASSGGL